MDTLRHARLRYNDSAVTASIVLFFRRIPKAILLFALISLSLAALVFHPKSRHNIQEFTHHEAAQVSTNVAEIHHKTVQTLTEGHISSQTSSLGSAKSDVPIFVKPGHHSVENPQHHSTEISEHHSTEKPGPPQTDGHEHHKTVIPEPHVTDRPDYHSTKNPKPSETAKSVHHSAKKPESESEKIDHQKTESSGPHETEKPHHDAVKPDVIPEQHGSQKPEHKGPDSTKHAATEHEKGNPGPPKPQNPVPVPPQPKERKFVLVIPVTSPSPDLCKTIVTALALGYPSPVIINWGLDYHTITKGDYGANIPKIPGLVHYLDAALRADAHPSEKLDPDDLVLMVDAYDVWFQLPAEVMLKRYHDINAKADARLREAWHGKGPMPMRQTIIAGSGKNCHPLPESGSDMHCGILPESPLRPDLYGSETDKNVTIRHNNRPRYINGGLYMGPAGDMRRLFRRATEKMEKGFSQDVHLFSEQGIPGEVLGEQEVWRQWRRDTDVSRQDAASLMDRDFEYHFGLDYGQVLSAQTFWTDNDAGLFDGDIITLNNRTAIEGHSAALGISPVRLQGVPADVKESRNPLDGIVPQPDWGEMPLYADFWTEAVPVILHHNGFKERRTTWWDRPWFVQYLRPLLQASLRPAHVEAPLAEVKTPDGVVRYRGMPAEMVDRKPRLVKESLHERLPSMQFEDVCRFPDQSPRPWWEEVFRDTRGPIQ